MPVLFMLIFINWWVLHTNPPKPKRASYSRYVTGQPSDEAKKQHRKNRKKPRWVVDKVLHLKAVNPDFGCGSLADTFNRIHRHKNESVSKTFVYNTLKAHQYQVQVLRRKIKHRQPKSIPVNQTWGIDLTTVNLSKKQKMVLGIADHGSRFNLCLSEITSKHSSRLIIYLCDAIKQYGFPNSIRTDNEACFNSIWFTGCLKLLGIKHQTTDIACPWQNGRIERFFGTFNQKWRLVEWQKSASLPIQLDIFTAWYNTIRPHQNLKGLTPKEAISGNRDKGEAQFVRDWDGVLTGYYFPD